MGFILDLFMPTAKKSIYKELQHSAQRKQKKHANNCFYQAFCRALVTVICTPSCTTGRNLRTGGSKFRLALRKEKAEICF